MNTVEELKAAESRWSEQLKLLQQLSFRLLADPSSDVYEWNVMKAQRCLAEMTKLAEDFPTKYEPFGPGYDDARRGMRECLLALEESLRLLNKAKDSALGHAQESGWQRVLENSLRR